MVMVEKTDMTGEMDKINKTVQAERLKTLPASDGFHMPGEFEPHKGIIMIWPERPRFLGLWSQRCQKSFCTDRRGHSRRRRCFHACWSFFHRVCESGFFWKVRKHPHSSHRNRRCLGQRCRTYLCKKCPEGSPGISWQSMPGAGEVDGHYASWEKDDAAAEAVCDALGYPVYDAGDFVLEGGSIHSDGEGTLLVTEACLLSPGRNPRLTKEEIEKKLCEYLGAKKVIWLKNGIWQDETNEHVDNVCAFVKPGEVVLAWTDDKEDPQYALSMEDYQILENETDAKGRKFVIHKLPIPEKPVCIQEEDLKGLAFEPGEDTREAGERLAASYVNFYIANEAVLVPQFQDKHDKLACDILGKLFPERKICPIDAQAIIIGGGNIHCITQQIPSGCGK